eukprot:349894-Chlamydomonas_euryale.AAC.11
MPCHACALLLHANAMPCMCLAPACPRNAMHVPCSCMPTQSHACALLLHAHAMPCMCRVPACPCHASASALLMHVHAMPCHACAMLLHAHAMPCMCPASACPFHASASAVLLHPHAMQMPLALSCLRVCSRCRIPSYHATCFLLPHITFLTKLVLLHAAYHPQPPDPAMRMAHVQTSRIWQDNEPGGHAP